MLKHNFEKLFLNVQNFVWEDLLLGVIKNVKYFVQEHFMTPNKTFPQVFIFITSFYSSYLYVVEVLNRLVDILRTSFRLIFYEIFQIIFFFE